MGRPTIGHLDPMFLEQLDQVQVALRGVFRTEHRVTLPISGTGSAGMEACFANLVEDGDEVVVGMNGVFGIRMADVATRLGGKVVPAEAAWGTAVSTDAVRQALARCAKPRVVAIVHAETSTGVWQPVPEIAQLAHDSGALVVLDTVTSLGGCPVDIDAWGIDAAYSGTQKCLSCPPGLSPLTFSEQALRRVTERKVKPRSWYFDLSLIGDYFGSSRVYHHTAPINMIYAIHEALRMVLEEGLEPRFARHHANHRALIAGLAVLDIHPTVAESERLWMLNSVAVPDGVDDREIRGRLLGRHGIEIGGGLGPLAGKIWRIGLMGESSRIENVRRLLACLAVELRSDRANQAIDAADRCA
ncbi:MAG TPA: alanine--glyoxylate aminotransferase family protein [Candidatus Binatia bacterium]|nr:alanine--glyoxylate aminotransferase family protein [Candidatus Binatia bacterium]